MTEQVTCSVCRARLSPGISWCGRCYTPVLRALLRPAVPEPDAYPDDLRFQPAVVPRRPTAPDLPPQAEYSRWRGTATTLGPLVKLAITLGLIALGFAAFPLLGRWKDVAGTSGLAFVVFYVGVLAVAGGLLLGQVWRRGRIR